jgi:hypothetical protein
MAPFSHAPRERENRQLGIERYACRPLHALDQDLLGRSMRLPQQLVGKLIDAIQELGLIRLTATIGTSRSAAERSVSPASMPKPPA